MVKTGSFPFQGPSSAPGRGLRCCKPHSMAPTEEKQSPEPSGSLQCGVSLCIYVSLKVVFHNTFIHVLLDLFQFFFANASGIFKLHFKGGGGEAEEEGDINIHLAHSHFCAAETNATLQSNYTPIKDK